MSRSHLASRPKVLSAAKVVGMRFVKTGEFTMLMADDTIHWLHGRGQCSALRAYRMIRSPADPSASAAPICTK